jgi:hypothetical protein
MKPHSKEDLLWPGAVRFLCVLLVFSLWGSGQLPAQTQSFRVRVNATQMLRTVDARLFGINTAIWDGLLDTPQTVAALRELDLQALRFPGGSLSDEYHWATGAVGGGGPCASSFVNFMHVATNIHAQTIITVNYGSGTPEEAAAWVRCANLTNHCDFKYWEIGNENYGNWEHDETAAPHDAVTYAQRAKEYFRQMKAVDPSIRIGVVVSESWKERAGLLLDALKAGKLGTFIVQGYQGWTPKMLATLKELGVTPDWVSVHRYPQNISGYENDAELLQSTGRWAEDAATVRAQLQSYFGAAGTNIEILCTENNSMSQNTGKQTTSLVNGLYLADSFGQIAQTEFKAFLWWDLRNMQDRNSNNSRSLYGWRDYGDHGIMAGHDTRYPTFYTLKLLKYFARGGDGIIRAASDHKLLSVYAARHANGALALLVINKSPQAVLSADVSITGLQPAPGATIYSSGIPQDEAARTGTGSQDIAMTQFSDAAAQFRLAFEPYSASVVMLSTVNK